MTTYQLPFRQAHPIQLAPTVRELQSQGGIHRVRTAVGHEAWLVTDYTQVRRLLDDDRLGRSHPRPETAARAGESALFGGPLGNFDTEAADHARMRALLQPHFAPKHMRTLLPQVEALTTGLLDQLEAQGPPADLHTALALPLPILVICELLGVPYGDRDEFHQWTDDVANVRDPGRSEHGLAELYRYGMTLVEHKRAHPAFDTPGLQLAYDTAFDTMLATVDRRNRLDTAIAEMAADSAYTPVVKSGMPARGLDVDRVRAGRGDRGLAATERPLDRRLSGTGAHRVVLGDLPVARVDHQDRQQPRPPAPAHRSRLASSSALPMPRS